MTSPVRAFQNEETGERFYTAVNPLTQQPRVSVTSVLGSSMPKQVYLMPWVGKVVAETAVEFMQDMLEHRYYQHMEDDELDFDAVAKDLAQSWKWERDAAGDVGDIVHVACEEIMRASKGDPKISEQIIEGGVYDEAVSHRLAHLQSFLQEHDVIVVDTEFTIYNDVYEYAGSCDLAAYIDGVPYIIDFKTGRVNADAALQLVAYKNGEYTVDGLDATGGSHAMPFHGKSNVRCGVIDLKPTFCRLIETRSDALTFNIFVALMALRKDWFGKLEKTALGDTVYDSRKEKS